MLEEVTEETMIQKIRELHELHEMCKDVIEQRYFEISSWIIGTYVYLPEGNLKSAIKDWEIACETLASRKDELLKYCKNLLDRKTDSNETILDQCNEANMRITEKLNNIFILAGKSPIDKPMFF